MILWLAGALACALFFLVSGIRCSREFRTSLPVGSAYTQCWLEAHPLRRTIEIRQSDRITAPLTYGVLHPVILMPKTTDWTDEASLHYILTHEYIHIRRFDTA